MLLSHRPPSPPDGTLPALLLEQGNDRTLLALKNPRESPVPQKMGTLGMMQDYKQTIYTVYLYKHL